MAFSGLDEFCHFGHDVGLRNGLAKADRQRAIFVGIGRKRLRHKAMAWYPPKGVEYDWIAHSLDSPSPARKLGPYRLVAQLLKALLATLRGENDDEAKKQDGKSQPEPSVPLQGG